ncbi:MAG TPA: ABC transporter permease [Vicinamibacterales bacterium]|nr:ABC transporter permease [Vicinamibacterales bacterium]
MSHLAADLLFALRLLRKDRAYTLATLLTLAFCVGANTLLFSVVNSVLLRPLPVPEPEQLVLMYNAYPKAGAERSSNSPPDYTDRKTMASLETLAFYNSTNLSIGERGRPERVVTMRVTPSFFRLTRVEPQLGRTFTEDEARLGQEDRIVLTDGLWRERFGADPAIVGRQVPVDGRPFTVVGVMPADFRFVNPRVRMYVPIAFTPQQLSDEGRHNNSFQAVGRLRPGATVAQAQAQVDAINAAKLESFPAYRQLLINAGYHTRVVPLKDDMVRDIRGTLYLLWGGTLFVLLIGCVNVVNLALARSRVRVREMATRFALGAGRWRLGRQLLTESLLLAFVSSALGLLLGWGGIRLLRGLNLEQVPRASEIRLDASAMVFTLGLAVALGLVIGAFPLINAVRANLGAVFHEAGRTGTGGRGARALRRSLVVTQVAVAFVLLLGAGLLMASFRQVLAIDPGFDPRGGLTASVMLPNARYPDDPELRAFAREAIRRIRALPGVIEAGATNSIPLGGGGSDSVIFAEGYQMQPGESVISPAQSAATPGYFQAMRIPLKRGRYLDDRDASGTAWSILVDERLARRFWGDRDPIGRRMYMPSDPGDLMATNENTEWLTVVGVVGEVKRDALVTDAEPVGAYYFAIDQSPRRLLTFAVRTATDPSALANRLRAEVTAIDPELPVFSTQPMEKLVEDSLVTRRWPVLLSAGFGLVALLLSGIGIYGVLAYLVTQRTREIGVRMALGGTPRTIFDLVAREGVMLVVIGFAAGGLGAFALRKSIEAHLYNVVPTDPAVLAATAAVLATVALVACAIPARRATRIDPVLALNRE